MKDVRSLAICFAVLNVIVGGAPAMGQDGTAGPEWPISRYPAIADIPAPVLLALDARDGKKDEFVKGMVLFSRYMDRDSDGLDRADIDEAQAISRAAEQTGGLRHLMKHDIDGDGVVTREEAERVAIFNNQSFNHDDYWRARVAVEIYSDVLRFDDNGDGNTTVAEYYKRTRGLIYTRQHERYRAMLDIDPNDDGKLMPEEVEGIARRAFELADANHDGVFDAKEHESVSGVRAAAAMDMRIGFCRMAKAKPGDLLVHLYDNSSRRQPDVTIAGQYGSTDLAVMRIEEGEQPIHLILYSYHPMIWQFEGAVERLSHVTVIPGFKVREDEVAPGAGTIGVPADIVEFLPAQSCGINFYDGSDEEGRKLHERALARAFERGPGRQPDVTVRGELASEASAPVITFVKATYDKTKANIPDGTPGKTLLEDEHWHNSGRETVHVDPASVLAPGPVERYEVLPGFMGIRQLVEEGKLERTDQGYKILKPITQFPAGSEHETFILPDGVVLPGGQWMYPMLVPQGID